VSKTLDQLTRAGDLAVTLNSTWGMSVKRDRENMNKRNFLRTVGAAGLALVIVGCAPMATSPDIVDIAASNDQFSTLVAAVTAAGLVETLKGDGPFTVFAPTNEAFAALPAGTVEDLLKPENKDDLIAVLTYHVVPGAVTSDQLVGNRLDVATVQGQTVHVNGTNGVRVNNARVTQADIIASNGVIHRIDRVLLPK
jgi:uncharacterized surface protein with fasciclin (FAS1) repeats